MSMRLLPLLLFGFLAQLYTASTASAQNVQQCAYPSGGWSTCDEGQAFLECKAAVSRAQASIAGNPQGSVLRSCEKETFVNRVQYQCGYRTYSGGSASPCPGHSSLSSSSPPTKSCATRPEQMGWKTPSGTVGGKVCNQGCAYDAVVDATSPNGLVFIASGSTCTTDDHPAPEPSTGGDDGGGGSGETGGGDGGGDSGGGDGGTNPGGGENGGGGGNDGDGEGEGEGGDGEEGGGTGPGTGPGTGDQEGDGQASGGEGCDAPPTCSGDPIACNTNWQIWRLRCNGTATGKVDGDVNDCSKPLKITSPDQLANAQLLLQRKIACKDGDQPAWTKVTGDGNDAGQDPDPASFVKTVNLDPTKMIDEQGFIGGGSCPAFGSVTIPALNKVIDFGAMPWFCDLMRFVRGLVILFFGALPTVYILLSRSM